jgi:hypothetical protein
MKGKNQTFECFIIIQTQCYVNFKQVFPWLARKQSSPWDQPQNDIALWMAKTTTMLGPTCTCISLNAIDQQSITIVWSCLPLEPPSHPTIQTIQMVPNKSTNNKWRVHVRKIQFPTCILKYNLHQLPTHRPSTTHEGTLVCIRITWQRLCIKIS